MKTSKTTPPAQNEQRKPQLRVKSSITSGCAFCCTSCGFGNHNQTQMKARR